MRKSFDQPSLHDRHCTTLPRPTPVSFQPRSTLEFPEKHLQPLFRLSEYSHFAENKKVTIQPSAVLKVAKTSSFSLPTADFPTMSASYATRLIFLPKGKTLQTRKRSLTLLDAIGTTPSISEHSRISTISSTSETCDT